MEIKTVEVGQKDVYVHFDEAIWQTYQNSKLKLKINVKGTDCGPSLVSV